MISALYEGNITNELHFYYKYSDKKLKQGIIGHIYSRQTIVTETVILLQRRVISLTWLWSNNFIRSSRRI